MSIRELHRVYREIKIVFIMIQLIAKLSKLSFFKFSAALFFSSEPFRNEVQQERNSNETFFKSKNLAFIRILWKAITVSSLAPPICQDVPFMPSELNGQWALLVANVSSEHACADCGMYRPSMLTPEADHGLSGRQPALSEIARGQRVGFNIPKSEPS